MALTNLWGSYFSRIEQGGAMVRPFRRGLFNRVGLNVGARAARTGATRGCCRRAWPVCCRREVFIRR